ncbi:hypothetical protein Q5P01_011084 [Channa striata]|uniref:FXYD domain-containing ion transport regulator n=1 Tax=Channa striata TaxID=64152 RepID=A0AA88MSQ1_CHASR|nr:hypothetical protein Q5P01_011084 [Channa striata]
MSAGRMDLLVFVAFCSWVAPALASGPNEDEDYDSAFQYDYESLRIAGLVFAVVLFVMGIALIVKRVTLIGTGAGNVPVRAATSEETMFPDQSEFDYDYETLRTTGVILAVIMFVSGILIALSKKFTKCVKSSSNSSSPGTQIPKTEVPPQTV